MKNKVVFDTNILISALVFPGGNPDKVLRLARIGEIELLISPFILHEFERVLREKFNYRKGGVTQRLARIANISTLVEPSERVLIIEKDEPDNRILECAVGANAEFIVSGDKHLLELGEFADIRIVSATEFLSLMAR